MSQERARQLRDAVERARFSYENALTAARARRDADIAKAWKQLSAAAAREWAVYIRVQAAYEAGIEASLAP